jgi:hypothetical protein
MTQYLLSIYQPDGGTPAPEELAKIMREVDALNEEMRGAGVWVFSAGLRPPETAAVVGGGDGLAVTDGPYVEGKEHLGGIVIVEVDGDEAAQGWGRRLARATTLPVEVRPFQGPPRAG